MERKRGLLAFSVCVLALALAGCNAAENQSASTSAAAIGTPASQLSGGLTLSADALTEEPQFIDLERDGTPMQIIAIRDGAGEVQLTYNTCQVCAGSPYAYFEYQDGVLICQNCGNQFGLSSVGKVAGGCNPKPVPEYSVEGDSIVISEDALAQAAVLFKNWKVFQ